MSPIKAFTVDSNSDFIFDCCNESSTRGGFISNSRISTNAFSTTPLALERKTAVLINFSRFLVMYPLMGEDIDPAQIGLARITKS